MATITVSLIDVGLVLNAAVLVAVLYLLYRRDGALVSRNVTIERLSPELIRAGEVDPDEYLIMSFPEMSDREVEGIRDSMADAGLLNIVVTNREVSEVKKTQADIEGDEVTMDSGHPDRTA